MSDYNDPTAYRRTSTLEPSSNASAGSCGAPWFWIILFIVALLVIAALVVAVIYGYRRTTKDRILDFKGANVKVTSDTSITGSWPAQSGTFSSNDKITLWATLTPPIFNGDGSIANSKNKAAAPSGADSVTLNGLQTGLKYYATLTLTNSETANYQVYTQIIYMDSGKLTQDNQNVFAIEDIIQVGKVQYVSVQGNVQFNQKPSEPASLWKMISGQIVSNENTSICLYNNNGTLSSGECATVDSGSSKWAYNQGKFANQWCLANTINTDNPTCMSLGGISMGTATVLVKNDTNAGDAFVNAYEVVTP